MDNKHSTESILNLTLEIIYLLTGEEYDVLNKISGKPLSIICPHEPLHTRLPLPPNTSMSTNRYTSNMILDVAKKITELLTGEVPIRCQDVSVYLSMEEWEYLEGHKDLYKDIVMMEDQPPLTSPGGSSNRNTPERCPRPLDSQESIWKHQNILNHPQDELMKMKDEMKEEDMYLAGDPQRLKKVGISLDYKVEDNDHSPRVTSTGADINHCSADRSPDLEESCSDHSYCGITGSNDPFPCPECEKCFSEESNLVAHQRMHTAEGPFIYSEGDDVAADTPQVIHHNRSWPYSCSECGKSLKTKCELRVHERTHTGEEIFSCTECEKSFTAKSQLQKHQKYHTREKPFSCPQCKKSFMEKSQFVAHQRSHSGQKPFSCAECGKMFATKSHLVRHQKYHVNEKPFPCSECEMSFTTISGLVKHQRVHTGEKPFSCSQCGRSFSQKENFITHVKRHAGEMPFTCSECGKCFSSNGHLLTHQRTHTGERPFSCSECGRSFTQKVNLLRHEMRHKGERPYSCSECRKCFIDKAYLILHQRNHTGERPFECSECEKCFTRRGHLLKHQRTHTNVRPFSCSLCGKSYTEKGHFLTHQRTHTGERPFSCPECVKCFASKGYLLAHKKRHNLKHPLQEQSGESVLDE